jgi:SOS-response transcriptional repressor LexA
MPREKGGAYEPTTDDLKRGRALGTWFRENLEDKHETVYSIKQKTGIATSYLYAIRDDCYPEVSGVHVFRDISREKIRAIAGAFVVSAESGLEAFGYEPAPTDLIPVSIREASAAIKHHLGEIARLAQEGKIEMLTGADMVMIPLLGHVSAGPSVFAADNTVTMIPIPRHMVARYDESQCFAVRVQGDCLKGLYIIDGDILICKKAEAAYDKDIVIVVTSDNEILAKRFRENYEYDPPKWIETVPEDYDSHYAETEGMPRIIGIKVGLYREG